MSSKHIHIQLIIFISSYLWTIAQSDLVCAHAKNKDEPNYEIVNCKYPEKQLTIDYQCKILMNKELESTSTQNVVEADFKINFLKKDQSSSAVFYWRSFKEHSHSNFYREVSKFKYNKTVNFTYNNPKNISRASLVLYKIHYETVYEICVKVDGIIDNLDDVCCEIENREEEEESNIFMVLIVLGVLLLIYAFVILATWRMSHKEETIDELIESLPTAHVERLKSLFIENDDDEDDDENIDDEGENEEEIKEPVKPAHVDLFVKNKKGKSAKKVMIRDHDNHGYEPGEDEIEDKMDNTEEELDELEFNLYKETQKLRKMSRMSVADVSKDLRKLREQKGGKSVKFTDNSDTLEIGDFDKIKLKLNNESKRRASIKPFRKAYGLDVSDSD